jgi:transposase
VPVIARSAPALPLVGGGHTRFQPAFAGDVASAVVAAVDGRTTGGCIYDRILPEDGAGAMVYREVAILKKKAAAASKKPSKAVAIVSYDEKPGIQAIATTAPPEAGAHATFARDYEYKRHGTLSLLAGIDLVTGKVHALVKDRHRSREFVEFLKLLDAAYPADTAIKLILDNHSAHISRETKTWLAAQPAGRFDFTFTPKHGSWLNLVEGFFSKLARSVLRHIRVASKQELKDRIMAAIDGINQHPVVHTWSYKLNKAA